MSAVETLRGRIKERIEKEQGVRCRSALLLKACVSAQTVPDGERAGRRRLHHLQALRAHGIAVASEAGLVVAYVKDADRKGMLQSRVTSSTSPSARGRQAPDGRPVGWHIHNHQRGVFGSLVSTPIINYPMWRSLGCTRRRIGRLS